MFWNTRSFEKHTSAYNVVCWVDSNLNSFKLEILKTRSQSIWTRTLTGPDIWKCHHPDLNDGLASGSPAELLAPVSLENRRTELFPSGWFGVKQQGWAIWYHLIIIKSFGCLTFCPGWRQCQWLQSSGYNFGSFSSGWKRILETHHTILFIPIPLSDNQLVIIPCLALPAQLDDKNHHSPIVCLVAILFDITISYLPSVLAVLLNLKNTFPL